MSSAIIPDVQVLDSTDTWQSAIAGLMSCQIDGGMAALASKPSVGKCDLLWYNADQSKNPDPSGDPAAALLRARRRIRVKATSGSQGNILQVLHAGTYGIGGTTTITASGQNLVIGNISGVSTIQAQTVVLVAGWTTEIDIYHGPTTGAPSGTVTWTLYKDKGGAPDSTVVATGTYTPTASSNNVIYPGAPAQIDNGLYWLILVPTTAQTSGNYWTWQASTVDAYASGNNASSIDGGVTWTAHPAIDCQCTVQTSNANSYIYQTVTRAIGIGDVWTLTFDARFQYDSYCNNLFVNMQTNTEYAYSGVVVQTNRWQTYTFVFTATLAGTRITPCILPYFPGNGKNSMAMEIRNVSLVKTGEGVNVLTNGDFSSGAVSPWLSNDYGSPPSSNTLSVIRDYRILFNGKISRIEPAPFQRAGDKTCHVIAVDFVDVLQRKTITGLALQKAQRGDQLVTTALALLQSGNLKATIPGKLLDTGKQVFSRAFDGYTQSTTLFDVITDCAVSEYGLWWVDPDGTLRWVARDYAPKRLAAGAKLTLTGTDVNTAGQPFNMMVAQDAATVVNKTVLTWHPRATVSTGVVLGQITSAIAIPPIQADGSPGSVSPTLTFRDPATQKLCGGDNVITPLVATTDYVITDNPVTGAGFDYTTNSHFGISVVSVDASQITVKLTNTATGTLYANKLQVRGDAVVKYDPESITTQDATAVALDDETTWTKDLPFNDDNNFMVSLGQYLVNRFKTPFDAVEWVSVDWHALIGGVDVLSIAPLDILAVQDTQSGLFLKIWLGDSSYGYYPAAHIVVRWAYQFTAQGADYIGNVAWGLERLDDLSYFILDDATYGKLPNLGGGLWNHLFI